MKKLRGQGGETLIETLTALLIATLVLLFLSTAVSLGARINRKIKTTDTSFRYSDSAVGEDITVTVKEKNGSASYTRSAVEITDESGKYLYYEGK